MYMFISPMLISWGGMHFYSLLNVCGHIFPEIAADTKSKSCNSHILVLYGGNMNVIRGCMHFCRCLRGVRGTCLPLNFKRGFLF